MSKVAEADAKRVMELIEQIAPMLHGEERSVQGAVCADLLARWLAGHMDVSSKAGTDKLREELLAEHLAVVRDLIPVNEGMLLEQLRQTSH